MSTETIRRPGVRPKQAPPTRLEKLAKFARVRLLSLGRKLLAAGRGLLWRVRHFKFTPGNVLMVVGAMALVGLLAIGCTAVVKAVSPTKVAKGKVVAGEISKSGSQPAKISEAKFDYLVPGDGEWVYDPAGEVYDKTTGVVKYAVQRQQKTINVTVSQQEFPDALGSRGSEKFAEFTKQYKVVTSQETGKGEAYFMPALENGVQSSGTDTVIYATDGVLMFARSNEIMSYGDWVGLLAEMKAR